MEFKIYEKYRIYTDGAVSRNGQENSIGGWGYAVVNEKTKTTEEIIWKDSGAIAPATNQQMELQAVIEACEYIRCHYPIPTDRFDIEPLYTIYSDSAYVINCFKQDWWKKWKVNGWVNSKKQPVANKKYWQRLTPFFENELFDFEKIKGHNGDIFNEFVDDLAVIARLDLEQTLYGIV